MEDNRHIHPENKPPVWIDRLLKKICDSTLLEGILGDLHEMYEERAKHGSYRKANWWYVFDAIGFLRPFSWKKKK